MLPKLAVIDIGTNSVLLLIVELGEMMHTVFETATITRLGEGAYQQQGDSPTLQAGAMERTCEALCEYVRICQAYQVFRIVAYGTSVLRDASNTPSFLSQLRTRCGLEVQVISGDEEAQLAYLAVREDPTFTGDVATRWIVLDVGGGSTEWVVGRGTLEAVRSLQIGAVRLTEQCFHDDPPMQGQLAQAEQAIQEALADTGGSGSIPREDSRLVGIGGTLVNLGSVALRSQVTDPAIHGLCLTREDIRGLRRCFAEMPLAQRQRIPGLETARADVILAGTLIVEAMMDRFEAAEIALSTRGVRYGVARRYIG